MSKRRLVIVVLLVLSLAVLILLAKLPAILERVAVSKLEGLGANQIRLALGNVGLGATQLSQLSFVLERNARRYTLSLHDVDLSYRLPDLVIGHIDKINVTEVSVLIEMLPSSEAGDHERSIPAPADWLPSIPFNDLNLEHLKLELQDEEGRTRHIEVNGRLNVASASANARVDIKTHGYGTQRFELNMAPAGMSRLVLSDMRTPSLPVTYIALTSGAWTSTDSQLLADVAIDIDVEKLQQQLQQWGMDVIPKGTSGRLTAQGPLLVPFNNSPSWQPKGTLALQIPKLKNVGKQLMLDAPFEMALNNDQLQWHVGEGGQVSLKNLHLDKTHIKSVAVILERQAECGYQFEKRNWSCEPFALALTVPSIKNKQNNVATSTGRLTFTSLTGSARTWAASLDVDIPDWEIDIDKDKLVKQLKLDRVHGSIDVSNEKIHAKLALVAPRGGATVHINATHVMKKNAGQADYRLEPVDMQLHGSVFADTYSDWPAKLLLNAGIVGVVGKASWQGDMLPLQQATLTMRNVSGAYDEIIFAGLAGTLEVREQEQLHVTSPQGLSLEKLDIGVPITDMTLQAEIFLRKGGQPRGTVIDLAMNVLGGKMIGKHIELDFAREQNPFTLQVSGVDMKELLKLEQKQGLFGSGIIDGQLPLILTRDGISIQDGQLVARKPGGKLKYSANEGVLGMAESNAGLQLLITAMEDFNYKVLEADVGYTPDGLLKLKVRLKGSNPELEGGRPVHLNVDVEDNILELLRSLRLASEISEKIGAQVQKGQSGK
ncbi:MAG: YdbH domain-containing protein [Sulfuriflexus sp.]|nr:YdbH domain-containing protein [Sulfuriflexus sp.]